MSGGPPVCPLSGCTINLRFYQEVHLSVHCLVAPLILAVSGGPPVCPLSGCTINLSCVRRSTCLSIVYIHVSLERSFASYIFAVSIDLPVLTIQVLLLSHVQVILLPSGLWWSWCTPPSHWRNSGSEVYCWSTVVPWQSYTLWWKFCPGNCCNKCFNLR